MVSLTDLRDAGQQTEPVTVAGLEIACRPLLMREIAGLLQRFPALNGFVGGTKASAADLIDTVPEAIGAIIALGVGCGGDPEQEKATMDLPPGQWLALLEKIMALTTPGGMVPFVDRLTMLLGVSRSANAGKGPVTNLPPPSSS